MSTENYHELASRLERFFVRMVADWDSDWGVPESERILTELGELWKDRDDVASDIAALAMPSIQAFVSRPDDWRTFIKLANVYFSSILLPIGHPLAKREIYRERGGVRMASAYLDVARAIVVGLVNAVPPNLRSTVVLAHVEEDWPHLGLPEKDAALAGMDLTTSDLARILPVLAEKIAQDFGRGNIHSALHEWAHRHDEVARATVHAWVSEDPSVRPIPRLYIQILVEGVLASTPPDWREWRAGLLDCLTRSAQRESWQLAVELACFAWPKNAQGDVPSVAARHALMLEQVQRFPSVLVLPALQCCARDAREFPAQAFETSKQLRALAGDSVEYPRLSSYFAGVAQQAAFGASPQTDLDPFEDYLACLLDVPAGPLRHNLDTFLGVLAKRGRAAAVRRFVADWLDRNGGTLGKESLAFSELLPLLSDDDDPDRASIAWVIYLLVDPRDRVWRQARRFLEASRGRVTMLPSFLAELDDERIAGLVYRVLALRVPNRTSITLILALAEARPGVVAELREALLEFLSWDLPGVTETELRSRISSEASSAATDVWHEVLMAIESRRTRGTVQREMTALRSTMPSLPVFDEYQRRLFAEAYARSKPSLVDLLATTMPIARGSASAHPSLKEEIEFKEVSFEMELPLLDAMDPLSRRIMRHLIERRAAALLGDVAS